MRRVWFVALAVVAAAFAFGGAAKSSPHGPPAGPPDTYITSWDAVANQAFSAAALTPPGFAPPMGF
jgi:hypothetical protein